MLAQLSFGEHEWSSLCFSCHPSRRAAQEQALQLRLVKNHESRLLLALCLEVQKKRKTLLEHFEIVSDFGDKEAFSVLGACNYVGLHCSWENRFAKNCLTFPNGDSYFDFPPQFKRKIVKYLNFSKDRNPKFKTALSEEWLGEAPSIFDNYKYQQIFLLVMYLG